MTTALVTSNQQELTQLLPELALRLIVERVPGRMVDDAFRGRYYERIQHPPLTGAEEGALGKAAAMLQEAMRPGARAVTIAILARLANHRTKEKTQQEWKMLFEDYAEDLAEFSNAHVNEAVVEHRRTSNWYPTIAELRGRCLEFVNRDRFRLERVEKILCEVSAQ